MAPKSGPARGLLVTLALLAGIAFLSAPARADRKYFVYTYTPWVASKGTSEFETWLTAKTGKQDPEEHVSWDQRYEIEHAVSDRFTAAAYLNFSQESGAPLTFEAPSLEFIYRLAAPGELPIDPALYLEITETGEEIAFEPKILLGKRFGSFVSAMNLVGEFEYRHNDEELLDDGEVLHKEFKAQLTGGLSWEAIPQISLGVEGRYLAEYPNFDSKEASLLSIGPCANFQSGNVQLGIAVLPQISGTPQTTGDRNLVDFEKTQIRAILGITL